MRVLTCTLAACASFGITFGSVGGANFWLSTTGPLNVAAGSTPPPTDAQIPMVAHNGASSGTLYIWCRPDSGETLQNWSLRVISSDTNVVRLTSSNVEEFNPLGPGPTPSAFRWEYTNQPAGSQGGGVLQDLQGFRGLGRVRFSVGIGESVSASYNDQFYDPDPPASWLLASFQYDYLGVGTAAIDLQIGAVGMNHSGENSSMTNVIFGALAVVQPEGSPIPQTILNADTNRLTDNLSPEALITTVENADFDSDGDVDGSDFLTWQRGIGIMGTGATRLAGNANGDQVIDGADLGVWRSQFGMIDTGSVASVPEPLASTLILAAFLSAAVARRET